MIMVFKMIQTAQTSWRRLDGQNQLPKVTTGVKFTDGIETGHQNADT
jgi:putative transposase